MRAKLTKTLIVGLALACLLGCATTGQTSEKSADVCIVKDGKVFDANGHPMTGCVARFDGKMMTATDAGLVPMKKNMRNSSGTKCLVDGTCIMKDGSRRKFKEGEVLTPEGKFLHIKGHKARANT